VHDAGTDGAGRQPGDADIGDTRFQNIAMMNVANSGALKNENSS
jgi:hypothetical protein